MEISVLEANTKKIEKVKIYDLPGVKNVLDEISSIFDFRTSEERDDQLMEINRQGELEILVTFLKKAAKSMQSLCEILIECLANEKTKRLPIIEYDIIPFSLEAMIRIKIGVVHHVGLLLQWTQQLQSVTKQGDDFDAQAKKKIEKASSLELIIERIEEMKGDWNSAMNILLENPLQKTGSNQSLNIPAKFFKSAQNLRREIFDLEFESLRLYLNTVLSNAWTELESMLCKFGVNPEDDEFLSYVSDIRKRGSTLTWRNIEHHLKRIFAHENHKKLSETEKESITSHFKLVFESKENLNELEKMLKSLRSAEKNPKSGPGLVKTIIEQIVGNIRKIKITSP